MGPEPFVADSDARLSCASGDISGNHRCPCCHERSFTECEKQHASQVWYSHNIREMVEVVVEFPLREELLRLGVVSREYVGGLSEEAMLSSSADCMWRRSSSVWRGVSSSATSSSASSAASSATSSTASPTASLWGVFSGGALDGSFMWGCP